MATIARSIDFSWKGTQLRHNNKNTSYNLLPHVCFNDLYYCSTPYGNSLDFYNLSRSKQHLISLFRKDHR